jgi:hypothetical protein
VKGLIPNGRNDDGTLNNIEFTISKVRTLHVNGLGDNYRWLLIHDVTGILDRTGAREPAYDPDSNYWQLEKNQSTIISLVFGRINTTNGILSEFVLFDNEPVDILKRSDRAEVSGWSMPTSKYIDLTLGSSRTTYTAPANGWFYVDKNSNGSQYLDIGRYDKNGNLLYIESVTSVNGSTIRILTPVKKNDLIRIDYNVSGTTNLFRFIYAEGEQ